MFGQILEAHSPIVSLVILCSENAWNPQARYRGASHGTPSSGGHVEQCDHCGHRRVRYNSCRNRHCPTCQSLARATWLDPRRADLLPPEYFHVVFSVPPAVDGDRIRDRATYERPRQPSEGTVNGRFAVQDGDATGALAGRSIRRP